MAIYKTGINKNTIRNPLKHSEPIVEVVYNSVDGKATKIDIKIDVNNNESSDLFGSFNISIFDNGTGISTKDEDFKKSFATYQDSPKKDKIGMYGKRGQGRFKYLKLVNNKLSNLKIYTKNKTDIYQIKYIMEDDTIGFDVDKTTNRAIEDLFYDDIKTIVIFEDIDKNIFEFITNSDFTENDLDSLISNIKELVTIHIADALISKKVSVKINDELLNVENYIFQKKDEIFKIENEKFNIKYIVWNEKLKLKKSKHILYFDDKSSYLFTSPSGSNKDSFGDISYGHTILVYSKFFKTLDEMIYTQYVTKTSNKLLNELQYHIINVFRKIQLSIWNKNTYKVSKTYQNIISDIENEKVVDDVYHAMTMPFIYNNKLNPNEKLKGIIGRLIKVLVQVSPTSYADNMEYIADLKNTDNEIFDYVRSNLDIIDIVMKKEKYLTYLDTLEHFDNMVNGTGKAKTKERTELQKVIEKNLWIINEEYEDLLPDSFAGDKSLKTIFKDLGMSIYNDPDIINSISKITNKKDLNKVPDLFIPITNKKEKIIYIIELKKPTVPININIIMEVREKYLRTINKLSKNYNSDYKIKAYAISSEKTGDVPSSIGNLDKDKQTIEVRLWKDIIENAKQRYNLKLESIDLEIKNSKWNSVEDLINEFIE
jgi:hypothetical protein